MTKIICTINKSEDRKTYELELFEESKRVGSVNLELITDCTLQAGKSAEYNEMLTQIDALGEYEKFEHYPYCASHGYLYIIAFEFFVPLTSKEQGRLLGYAIDDGFPFATEAPVLALKSDFDKESLDVLISMGLSGLNEEVKKRYKSSKNENILYSNTDRLPHEYELFEDNEDNKDNEDNDVLSSFMIEESDVDEEEDEEEDDEYDEDTGTEAVVFTCDCKTFLFCNEVANQYVEFSGALSEDIVTELEELMDDDYDDNELYQDCIQKEIEFINTLEKNTGGLPLWINIKRCKYNPTTKRAENAILKIAKLSDTYRQELDKLQQAEADRVANLTPTQKSNEDIITKRVSEMGLDEFEDGTTWQIEIEEGVCTLSAEDYGDYVIEFDFSDQKIQFSAKPDELASQLYFFFNDNDLKVLRTSDGSFFRTSGGKDTLF